MATACELMGAHERGEPPTYVVAIEQSSDSWTIRFSGRNHERLRPITGTTETDLIDRCRDLAARRILFSCSAHGWEPADVMAQWQERGRVAISFLRLAWCGAEEWTVHEMVPENRHWRLVPIAELLAHAPIRCEIAEFR